MNMKKERTKAKKSKGVESGFSYKTPQLNAEGSDIAQLSA